MKKLNRIIHTGITVVEIDVSGQNSSGSILDYALLGDPAVYSCAGDSSLMSY